MKELLVVSGKGGTGKTTVAAALASLVPDKVVADCDVDAADLYLVLSPTSTRTEDFYGLSKAAVAEDRCKGCGFCYEVCRYDAVSFVGSIARIAKGLCEGCGVCYRCCPFDAISMIPNVAGCVMESETPYGYLVHAQLGVGEENSGKLVAEVRERARAAAERIGAQYIIIDGPPGIGCPVISSTSGVDMALVVTEPSVAGRHDLERILDLLAHFSVPAVVCINKCDLDPETSREIIRYCSHRGAEIVGQIPFDENVPRALADGRPLVAADSSGRAASTTAGLELSCSEADSAGFLGTGRSDRARAEANTDAESPAAREVRRMWERVRSLICAPL